MSPAAAPTCRPVHWTTRLAEEGPPREPHPALSPDRGSRRHRRRDRRHRARRLRRGPDHPDRRSRSPPSAGPTPGSARSSCGTRYIEFGEQVEGANIYPRGRRRPAADEHRQHRHRNPTGWCRRAARPRRRCEITGDTEIPRRAGAADRGRAASRRPRLRPAAARPAPGAPADARPGQPVCRAADPGDQIGGAGPGGSQPRRSRDAEPRGRRPPGPAPAVPSPAERRARSSSPG